MTGEKTLMPFVPYWELFMYLLRDPRISDKKYSTFSNQTLKEKESSVLPIDSITVC
jgi:hypothetical protein